LPFWKAAHQQTTSKTRGFSHSALCAHEKEKGQKKEGKKILIGFSLTLSHGNREEGLEFLTRF